MKTCTRCLLTKPLKDFTASRATKDKRGAWCKTCGAEAKRLYYAEHPGLQLQTARKSFLKKRYGLTLEEYQAMWDAQRGVCAICGAVETSKPFANGATSSLSVDHNHSTGEVRALLCNRCNRGLGMLGDNLVLLRSVVTYLEKYA